jgi:ArsR family transcriptional regulator
MSALQLSQPKVSRHLAQLRQCGLLQDQRHGKWVYYRLHENLPAWARSALENTATADGSYLHSTLQLLETALASDNCC